MTLDCTSRWGFVPWIPTASAQVLHTGALARWSGTLPGARCPFALQALGPGLMAAVTVQEAAAAGALLGLTSSPSVRWT